MTTDQPTAPMSAEEPTYLARQTASIAQEITLMVQARVERECAALTAEVEALRADKERLDWMEANMPNGNFANLIASGKVAAMQDTVRGAIDAAILAAGETRDK